MYRSLSRPPVRLLLLISRFSHPVKDMVASTLAWMCRERDIEFDVYYASDREGGLFSSHGSALLGGRHYAAIARALAQFETTVIRLGDVHVFDSLIRSGASRVIEAPESVVDLYEQCAKEIGLEFPHNVVAFQTEGLPENLGYGLVQYLSLIHI